MSGSGKVNLATMNPESLSSCKNAVATRVLRDHFPDVVKGILYPGTIASELFAMGIVSDLVLRPAHKETTHEHSQRLVNEMLRAVENNAECLMKIVDVLEQYPPGNYLALVLKKEYECKSDRLLDIINICILQQP